jgi:GntR family transcriptional regulator
MPLWAQLEQDLRRRLAARAFEAGFPGEIELVQGYGVSRHTVREALRRLRQEGLIDSGRGRGSRVRERIEHQAGSLSSLFQAVEAAGLTQASEVLAQEIRVDPVAARALGRDPSGPLFYLERLRMADGRPLAHDQVWLPTELGVRLLGADFRHTGLYAELARHCGLRLTAGRERICAVGANQRQAELLKLAPGQACLLIERTGLLHLEPVELRATVIRGDRYAVLAEWSDQGYRVGGEAGPPNSVDSSADLGRRPRRGD